MGTMLDIHASRTKYVCELLSRGPPVFTVHSYATVWGRCTPSSFYALFFLSLILTQFFSTPNEIITYS
jgi:hypothetical protein